MIVMAFVFKFLLLLLWGGFFLLNLRSIAFRRVDAGTGVTWILIALLFFVGVCLVDPELIELLGPVVMLTLLPAQILLVFLLYSHEKAITEVRRKNNELAMEIALIYDHMKYFEKRPRTAGSLVPEQDRGE